MKTRPQEGLIDPKYLEKLLSSFSTATGLRIEAINNEGETVSIPGKRERSGFCGYIRSLPLGELKCVESYKRASREANKWVEPYFFRCHAGLVIWAVPIVLQGISLGCIICGQVLMWEPDHFFFKELKKLQLPKLDYDLIRKQAMQLDVISAEQSQAAADMLFVVVNHHIQRDLYVLEKMDATQTQQRIIQQELQERKKRRTPELSDYTTYLRKERCFLRYIRLGDRTRAQHNLQSLLTDLYKRAGGDKTTIRVRILELATLTSRAAVEGGADAERIMIILKEFNEEINAMERVEEFFLRIHGIVETFLQGIMALATKKHLSLVKKARDFILENYSLPLCIEDVARYLFISPSHLSRLFREELGCTINDYITRVRIEQAVELMKMPEMSVSQVSKAIGIGNPSYFAKVFRKYIGVTPLVYKNSLF